MGDTVMDTRTAPEHQQNRATPLDNHTGGRRWGIWDNITGTSRGWDEWVGFGPGME